MTDGSYPEDVQAALDRGRDEGWSIEVYQAALALALHHLAEGAKPELVEPWFYWAEEDIEYPDSNYLGKPVTRRISAGEMYVVCPLCLEVTTIGFSQETIEGASVTLEFDVDEAEVYGFRDDWQIGGGGDSWLDCRRCYRLLAVPAWLDFQT